MSKPVKELIMKAYAERFVDLDGALVVDVRGINANDNNSLRKDLRSKNIRVTIVSNNLARKALADGGLAPLTPVLEGPSAIAYGGESVIDVARELVQWARKLNELELKGAVLDGELYSGDAGVRKLSLFPTREEAQAKVVQLLLAPAGKLVGCATSPGAKLLGIVKELQERLEKGETISKIA